MLLNFSVHAISSFSAEFQRSLRFVCLPVLWKPQSYVMLNGEIEGVPCRHGKAHSQIVDEGNVAPDM
jgi:hypothetical protein